ncbi:hypothetical protein ON010_g17315 [Phytophthora cinnamomi]|nr:hypothetical protein ON010_g17315 [Phytophthora cinnamomi]
MTREEPESESSALSDSDSGKDNSQRVRQGVQGLVEGPRRGRQGADPPEPERRRRAGVRDRGQDHELPAPPEHLHAARGLPGPREPSTGDRARGAGIALGSASHKTATAHRRDARPLCVGHGTRHELLASLRAADPAPGHEEPQPARGTRLLHQDLGLWALARQGADPDHDRQLRHRAVDGPRGARQPQVHGEGGRVLVRHGGVGDLHGPVPVRRHDADPGGAGRAQPRPASADSALVPALLRAAHPVLLDARAQPAPVLLGARAHLRAVRRPPVAAAESVRQDMNHAIGTKNKHENRRRETRRMALKLSASKRSAESRLGSSAATFLSCPAMQRVALPSELSSCSGQRGGQTAITGWYCSAEAMQAASRGSSWRKPTARGSKVYARFAASSRANGADGGLIVLARLALQNSSVSWRIGCTRYRDPVRINLESAVSSTRQYIHVNLRWHLFA